MERTTKCLFALLTGLSAIDLAASQDGIEKPFAEYAGPASGFIFPCDCCLVPRVQVELGDMADVGALAAPRALLAVHGRKDGLHCFADVEAAMARLRAIYAAAGAPNRFRHEWGEAGHKFHPEIMWPFIESGRFRLHSSDDARD